MTEAPAQTTAPAAAETDRVPAVEMALNALVSAPPKPREKVHTFVTRCVSIVQGSRQRQLLKRAIMDTVNELGIRAVDPASHLQLALNATEEEKAEAAAAQDAQPEVLQ